MTALGIFITTKFYCFHCLNTQGQLSTWNLPKFIKATWNEWPLQKLAAFITLEQELMAFQK